MRNRFLRCCCDEVPSDPFGCSICNDLTCIPKIQSAGHTILEQRHPDEGTEDFVAKGRITGSFRILNATSYVRLIFNHNQSTGLYDYVQIKWGENLTFEIKLVREGGAVDTLIATVGTSRTDLRFYCLHFDEDGSISLRIYATGIFSDDVVWHTSLPPGSGGGVGFSKSDAATFVRIQSFSRALSESRAEHNCESCAGVICNPCCPNGAALNWLVTLDGGLLAGTYSGCPGIDGSYLLEPVRDIITPSIQPCFWEYLEPNHGFLDESGIGQNLCGGIPSIGPIPAQLIIRMRVVHANDICFLRLFISLSYASIPNLIQCDHTELGQWESNGGAFNEMCQGTHILGRRIVDDVICSGIPSHITVTSL